MHIRSCILGCRGCSYPPFVYPSCFSAFLAIPSGFAAPLSLLAVRSFRCHHFPPPTHILGWQGYFSIRFCARFQHVRLNRASFILDGNWTSVHRRNQLYLWAVRRERLFDRSISFIHQQSQSDMIIVFSYLLSTYIQQYAALVVLALPMIIFIAHCVHIQRHPTMNSKPLICHPIYRRLAHIPSDAILEAFDIVFRVDSAATVNIGSVLFHMVLPAG